MKALLHVGLALALVLAPALCCCNVRVLSAPAATASPSPACPTCPVKPAPQPKAACCQTAAAACCHEADAPDARPPLTPPAPSCCCYSDRPDAALTGSEPTVSKPEPAELLPLMSALAALVLPEHAVSDCWLISPERAGVDVRSATLFDRHVLRC